MQLLSQIHVNGTNAFIDLLFGDLTEIPKEHAVDILVVSAYPGSYQPVPGTLIHALFNKGIRLGDMAAAKEADLLKELGCWLSQPLTPAQKERFNFSRILCFEPRHQTTSPESAVGNIFRCINTFAFSEENNEIALPVLASGMQRAPLEKMLPAILDAAIFWLQNGLPLKNIKLVLHTQEQVSIAMPIFDKARQQLIPKVAPPQSFTPAPPPAAEPSRGGPPPQPAPAAASNNYDFFISYSHKQTDQIKEFVDVLKQKNNSLNIFYDRSSIPAGGLWLRQISDAIQHSKAVVCILSPEYSQSAVCWDEFQCAKVMELRKKATLIRTINFLNDANMPPIMAIYSYIDCTEGDMDKLKCAADELLKYV
ncbi:toll/interleukin-1 receptor domain-containing protein [Foetidibacter luteolus]|uniref:toll/interleukin-1 receptor domain-containing protein n=1 Tax=Foetidibacter luteolus TaxID=2608880 RepID=UPI001A9988FF|nr:toll/interleukin-1 receptor domain-containing protein [Foetidibacter luteolus]